MKMRTSFELTANRYTVALDHCRADDGWMQYDTNQDSVWFGIWVHHERREIVTFEEGDVVQQFFDDEVEYRAELEKMADFYETRSVVNAHLRRRRLARLMQQVGSDD